MNLSDLKNFDFSNINLNLDFQDVGSWPLALKGVVILILMGALIFTGYWFDTKVQLEQYAKAVAKEAELKLTFEAKQARAVNLDAYKAQLAEMERSFGAMLRQLPDRTEVAELLVDVSQTGLASGLEFELFEPAGEVKREFYAELPIKLKVAGNYHHFGDFVSGLSELPRIVTLHNINITRKSSGKLTLDSTAKTYRYLEESGQ